MDGFAQCPFHDHVCRRPVVISHVQPPSFNKPATLSYLVSHLSDAQVAKVVCGFRTMDARQRHFRNARVWVEVGQEMPPTSGASWMRESDGGLAGDVVLVRDALEVKNQTEAGSCQQPYASRGFDVVLEQSWANKCHHWGGRENAEHLGV